MLTEYYLKRFCMFSWFITKTCLFKHIENFTSKKWKCSDKKRLIFFIFLLVRRGGSKEYPQSVFLSRNKKNNVYMYPCKPQFYYIKLGFKRGQYYIRMFWGCLDQGIQLLNKYNFIQLCLVWIHKKNRDTFSFMKCFVAFKSRLLW